MVVGNILPIPICFSTTPRLYLFQVREVVPKTGKVVDITDGSEPVIALAEGAPGTIYVAYQNNKVFKHYPKTGGKEYVMKAENQIEALNVDAPTVKIPSKPSSGDGKDDKDEKKDPVVKGITTLISIILAMIFKEARPD